MNTMKKIGLITIYHVPNFGSVLQTYATQILLEKLGYECNIINYKYPNKWHHMQGTPKQSFKAFIGHLFGIKPAHRKANKLKEFKKEHFKFTRLYKDLDELKNADWSYYDMFVVGSDQVWKSQFTHGDSAFMLSFIPEEKPRISIASSFASKNISDAFKDKYRKYLRKFNAISVREKNGISIIKDELKIECTPEVLLDPTLLLSKEEWLETIPRSTFKKKKKYILLYMLTYAFEPRPYIFDILKHMQQQDDYDILALEGYTPKEDANGLEMIDKTDSSIPEFIDMFANADIVVTSSFHGTAFAINFGIPLISVVPNGDEDDRQTTLLKSVGLGSCIAAHKKPIEEIRQNYNVCKLQDKLSDLREASIKWIKENLQ